MRGAPGAHRLASRAIGVRIVSPAGVSPSWWLLTFRCEVLCSLVSSFPLSGVCSVALAKRAPRKSYEFRDDELDIGPDGIIGASRQTGASLSAERNLNPHLYSFRQRYTGLHPYGVLHFTGC